MSLDHNPFSSKLHELEEACAQMSQALRRCHQGSREDIAQAKNELWDACRQQEQSLEEAIASGRSQAVTDLASMQLHYFRQVRSALEETVPRQLMDHTTDSGRAEAMSLFAEFAMDNAVQAMRYALCAAYSAVELQMKAEGGPALEG